MADGGGIEGDLEAGEGREGEGEPEERGEGREGEGC